MPEKNKQQTIEYRLLVVPTTDDTLKKEGILFLLETTKLFANFSYFIDIHDTLNAGTLRWSLHGLKAPSLNMPATGSAQFRKVYFNLPKTLKFTLIKKDNIQASTAIKFLKSSVVCNDSAVNFLKIYTDQKTFESQRIYDAEVPEYKPDIHREASTTKTKVKKK